MTRRPSRRWLLAAAAATIAAVAVAAVAVGRDSRGSNAYVMTKLVSDGKPQASVRDRHLRNAWGLAASPTGPWWTANEAQNSSTLYADTGAKQLLTVTVEGGPTGIVYNPGRGFEVAGGGRSGPARFIYAGEDGMIRGWSPVVPEAWSTEAVVAVDAGAEATVFRGLALAMLPDGTSRLYATDFHNDRVLVYDERWQRVRTRGAFVDPQIPEWYAPSGIRALGSRIFVTYAFRAPVNGNDAPHGGYVDEFDLHGRLVTRVDRMGPLNAPWGLAIAPSDFGAFGGDLLVGNFGDGRVNAYRRSGGAWKHVGDLRARDGKPITISGLWGLSFGNDGSAGRSDTLFFTSGPHTWRGVTEDEVHGLLGSIAAAE
jgi:uncharacterized protein (TIGR03118 family)